MLSARQLEKYADVLIWGLKTARSARYRAGDIIAVRYELAAIRLAEILHAKLLDQGMNPVLRLGATPRIERQFFEKANNEQIAFNPPGEKELCEKLNGSIYLHAPESITHLSHIDPKRIGRAALARKPLRDILWKREEKGLFGWTLCLLPTDELRSKAGLSEKQYTNQVVRACYLDKKDPVGEWKKIHREAGVIKKWINGLNIKTLLIQSDNMDIRITQGDKRKWVGVSGHNIPSFEIFISPDWRGTEGLYYADQPSYRSGNYVEGVRLVFKKGVAVETSARKGGDFLKKQLSTDAGARRVGEFSLTDKRFSKINRFMANTLYDENYGGRYGNCHLAVGMSYTDVYDGDPSRLTKEKKENLGFNDSALHWDLVNTEKKVVTALLAGGGSVIIYENGMFTYDR
ncbi:MAG: aminopeptidase [Deltaproteobacteria bacterium]|nr:aminopeptidase [Deltaproteobacteria bacterium]